MVNILVIESGKEEGVSAFDKFAWQNLLDYETIVKCYEDEHLKQSIALKLLEEISNFPLEKQRRGQKRKQRQILFERCHYLLSHLKKLQRHGIM